MTFAVFNKLEVRKCFGSERTSLSQSSVSKSDYILCGQMRSRKFLFRKAGLILTGGVKHVSGGSF